MDVSRQLYGRIRKKLHSRFHIGALGRIAAPCLHFGQGLHFGLDTPKSMTLGYIANLSANQ